MAMSSMICVLHNCFFDTINVIKRVAVAALFLLHCNSELTGDNFGKFHAIVQKSAKNSRICLFTKNSEYCTILYISVFLRLSTVISKEVRFVISSCKCKSQWGHTYC